MGPGEDIRFEVCDLYALPELDLPSFDITLFNGIFYHLPEPVTGLKIAADLTKEHRGRGGRHPGRLRRVFD